MGWAARARTGLHERTMQALRRRHLTTSLMPRVILWQIKALLLALLLFPVRFIAHRRRRHAQSVRNDA